MVVLKAERLRLKKLLSDAIPLLCKTGLSFQSQCSIEALIGITLDENEVILVSFKETVLSSKDVIGLLLFDACK